MLTKKKRSQKQEKSVAKNLDAKTVIASGAFWGAKGDVRSEQFLFECKTTEKPKYNFTAKSWEKITKQATADHMRTPVFVVDICDRERFFIVNAKDFISLIEDDEVSILYGVDLYSSFVLHKGEETPALQKITATPNYRQNLFVHELLILNEKQFKEAAEKWD